MSQHKIIGFDMDGVIIDHTDLKILLAKDRGFQINRTEAQSDVVEKIIPFEKWREIQMALYDDRRFALSQPLMSGIQLILGVLKKKGIPYFLISRRKNGEVAQDLLRARGLWPKYFNKKNTFFVLTKEDKNTKAVELGITHYIDDEPSVLEKLVDVKNKFLFDPYGAFVKQNVYKRLTNWEGSRVYFE